MVRILKMIANAIAVSYLYVTLPLAAGVAITVYALSIEESPTRFSNNLHSLELEIDFDDCAQHKNHLPRIHITRFSETGFSISIDPFNLLPLNVFTKDVQGGSYVSLFPSVWNAWFHPLVATKEELPIADCFPLEVVLRGDVLIFESSVLRSRKEGWRDTKQRMQLDHVLLPAPTEESPLKIEDGDISATLQVHCDSCLLENDSAGMHLIVKRSHSGLGIVFRPTSVRAWATGSYIPQHWGSDGCSTTIRKSALTTTILAG